MRHGKLLNTISKGIWFIDERVGHSYAPFVASVLKGKVLNAYPAGEIPVTTSFTISSSSSRSKISGSSNSNEQKLIAVHPIKGLITKEDQDCGPRGTESLMKALTKMDNNPNVIAHILEADSGGGDGSNCKTTANFIRYEIKKPVITWYNGLNGSACYWITSSADEVYASEQTDIVGSIGAYLTFYSIKKHLKKKGIVVHEIYAPQSKQKNKPFKDAEKGNYEEIQNELLRPYAQSFIDSVKSMRNIKDDSLVFAGKTYMSNKAIEINLIDGIKTFDEVVARASELGNQYSNSNNHHQVDMKNDKILAVLGINALESVDGHVSLSVDNIEKINAALSEEQTIETTENPPIESTETVETNPVLMELQKINSRLDDQDKKINAWSEKKPADETTKPVSETEDDVQVDEEWDKISAKAGWS